MRRIFLVLLFVVLALAFVPTLIVVAQQQLCNSVPMKMSLMATSTWFSSDDCIIITDFEVGTMYVDYVAQKSRFDMQMSPPYGNMTMWVDYNTMIVTMIYYNSMECTVGPYSQPLVGPNLPSNAKYTGSFSIGSQQTDQYYIPSYPIADNNAATIVLASDTCFPISGMVFNTTTQGKDMGGLLYQSQYWNVAQMVPEFIFDIPASCMNMSEVSEIEILAKLPKSFKPFIF